MKLSILVPVLNEVQTVATVIRLVCATLPQVAKEIVVVDDGSDDGSRDVLLKLLSADQHKDWSAQAQGPIRLSENCDLILILHDANYGKGRAIQSAMRACSGDIIVIQDADLEYDPADWEGMYRLIADLKVADVVFGSRFYGKPHRSLYFHHYVGNRIISTLFNILYNQTLTDIECCYKMFTRDVLSSLTLSADDFGIEIQISAQIAAARRWRVYEMAVHYYGRTYEQGKKITWKDGFKALWYLVRFRLAR